MCGFAGILSVRPGFGSGVVWPEKFESTVQARAVSRRIVPKIHTERGGESGDVELRFEIEGAVAEAVLAHKLQRLAAVRRELIVIVKIVRAKKRTSIRESGK